MSEILKNVEPKAVFKWFEAISQIPRGSKNEQAISDYLVAFAKERNFKVVQDDFLNVYITKPASQGYENAPKTILQGHMDMVNEKNADTQHDFLKDPIKLMIEGDFVTADGTTLGADNGIAVAMGMALLDGEYAHGQLMLFITSDEEAGMTGAKNADPGQFAGYDYFINLDSGDDGSFTVSCAGGMGHVVEITAQMSKIGNDKTAPYRIEVTGLNGGHSGIDIDKGLANANKVLAQVLNVLVNEDLCHVSDVSGGLKTNAIPREALGGIYIAPAQEAEVKGKVDQITQELKAHYQQTEPDLTINFEPMTGSEEVISEKAVKQYLRNMLEAPIGLQSKNSRGDLESSNSIGVVRTENGKITLHHATRSSVLAKRKAIVGQVEALANETGAVHIQGGSYPGWEYAEVSPLRDKCVDVYTQMFGTAPNIESTHGGLECGIFSEKMPHLDMISYGPNNYCLHTPDEHLSISSTQKVYGYMVELLASLK